MSPQADGGLRHWPLPRALCRFLAICEWYGRGGWWAYHHWSTQGLLSCRMSYLPPHLSGFLKSTPLPPPPRLSIPPGGSCLSAQRKQQLKGSEPRGRRGASFFVETEVGTVAGIKHVEVPT